MKLRRRSAQAGWAKSIAHGTRDWTRQLQSRFCRDILPMIPCGSNALSGKQNHFQSESASHLHIARYWFTKRGGLSCDGVRGRRGAGEAAGKRAAAIGAGAEIRGANCGRAGQRNRARIIAHCLYELVHWFIVPEIESAHPVDTEVQS